MWSIAVTERIFDPNCDFASASSSLATFASLATFTAFTAFTFR
jgi:hypothetical protein